MAITYDSGTNKITVIGYSPTTPCNFLDLWNADKAGTLTLFSGTPATNITLSTQIQPSDELALKIDFILASSGAGSGDTIAITGTDKDDNAQSETLTTEADGTFTTTKWFKTITDIDCNSFSSGTLTVRQNQWGVVWMQGNIFHISASLYFGDISTDTWFADSGKQIFYTGTDNFISCASNRAYLTFGEVENESEKTTKNGCYFEMATTGSGRNFINSASAPKELYLYDCTVIGRIGYAWLSVQNAVGRIWSCKMQNIILRDAASNLDIDNIQTGDMQVGVPPTFLFSVGLGSVNKWSVFNADYAVCHARIYPFNIENLYARNIRNALIYAFFNPSGNSYAINWDVDWTNAIGGSLNTARIYRQYSFNAKLTNPLGVAIEDAKLYLTDKDDNQALSNPDSGEIYASTNSNGEIAEQIVTYGYYDNSGGNTINLESPHNLIIKHYEFLSYLSKMEINAVIDYVLTLTEDPYITKTEAEAATIDGGCTP